MPRVDTVEMEIASVEGFKVRFCHTDGRDVRGDKDGLPSYSYQRGAWNDIRVAQWREQRFWFNYPDYGVSVLLGDGTVANGNTKLATVRNSYREKAQRDEPAAQETTDESIYVRTTAEGSTTAVWVVRAGYRGDEEPIALENNLATIHWNELPDLSEIKNKDELAELYRRINAEETPNQSGMAVYQVWAFRSEIKKGDLIILPLVRMWHALAIGEVTGSYVYRSDVGEEVRHTLPVEWFLADLPRSRLEEDLSKALGRPPTIYRINTPSDAEQRFRAILCDEIDRRQRRIFKNCPSQTIGVSANTIVDSRPSEQQSNEPPHGWKKLSGFGYVCHTYVTFWETPEGQQCVELQGHKSRQVKNLYETDDNGNSLLWTLIKELEKEIIAHRLPSGVSS